ncbi:hypothetical protein [Streptacidiphilus sp. EB129]|uniref:hypothetical protein n=1 Tax=Streptacidiphilus sp. EB129 TaxID=3156262 RepID=UPI0035193759
MDTGPETHRLPEESFGSAGWGSDAFSLPELTPLPPAEPADEGRFMERELRPERRLRLWQLVPIVGLAVLGSLMFAFPLAFESGGPLVGMLGLLLTAASAGWGAMAARRAGYAWPGLPRQGSGRRAGWRALLVYTALALSLLALGLWRVSGISG